MLKKSLKALRHDPSQRGSNFETTHSHIEGPKFLDQVSLGSSSENTLDNGNKEQILELIRDKILTPRNYEGIEFLNVFIKADWSCIKWKTTSMSVSSCLIATLTSTFQLIVHAQLESQIWTPMINVSKTANAFLKQKWDGGNTSLKFDEYKSRLRELTIVDFVWMPRLDAIVEEDSEALMITASADGHIDIWWMFPTVETGGDGGLVGEIICSKMAFPDEIISAMSVHHLDKNLGVLAVGTNSGSVKIFRIECKGFGEVVENPEDDAAAAELSTVRKPKYDILDGIQVWEKDSLRIEFFKVSMIPIEERNILKRISIHFLFLKHPYHLCSCTVSVFGDGLANHEVEHIKLPEGPIVGIDRYSDDVMMCCHESGTISLVFYKNGVLKYIDDSAHSIKDQSINADFYSYSGFVFTKNKGLAIVGKHLNSFYDHNIERQPGKLVVFSTIAPDEIWDALKEAYRAHDCSFEDIPDILLAFRHQIRAGKEFDVDKYLDGPGRLEIAPDLLKLYLWVLRSMAIPSDEELLMDEELIKKIEIVFRRQQEVEDDLIQRHLISVLESIEESMLPNLTLEETQSIYLIQTFLNSKPNLSHLSFEPLIIPAEKPKCLFCSNEYEFMSEERDPLEAGSAIKGYEWSNQQCIEKHTFPVCAITLLPCKYPYRSCEICGVICMLDPLFGQKPNCPFCGCLMMFSDTLVDAESEGEGSDLDDPPGVKFLGVTGGGVDDAENLDS